MDTKKYRVKFENGMIKPLEPIDIHEVKEGIVIFFDVENKTDDKVYVSLLKHAGTWVGDDFEECLKDVYDARGKAQF